MSGGADTAPGAFAIVGLGLIGGSMARDLAAVGVPVVGVDRDPHARAAASAAGVLRQALGPEEPLPTDVEVVVLALPVPAIPGAVRSMAAKPAAGERAPVITDVGSTKRSALAAAAEAGLAHRFVGCHPMAGDHRSGWAASRGGLFKDARVWICAGAASPEAVARVAALWTALGARPEPIDAATHDRLVGLSSHLPQAVASALAGALRDRRVARDALGRGGADTTRLAASDPDLWAGILLDNADEIVLGLETIESRLLDLGEALRRGDAAAVTSWLRHAAEWAAR
ncbi:MAG: prephenate dehydrogenase/arogenate dehydrogenase family protein [Gemmatimonadetes bacterium]|nr:prephenate dehydrogenase/arogenate dehydrogenase family protein [Gemmatimonadota bacterium]